MNKGLDYKAIDPRRHVLASQQFNTEFLNDLFSRADRIKQGVFRRSLEGKVVGLLFYEPSTRTRLSFDLAANLLGAHVFSTENARDFSSAVKGESIEDTVRVVGDHVDIIVIRYHEEGGADAASMYSRVPIINAGDGAGQHPTQALLDVYTIQEHFKRLDNLTVAMVGDLKRGRTVRSLAYLLSKFEGNKLWFVSTEENRMKMDILDHLRRSRVDYIETDELSEVLGNVDVIYMTRTQKERMGGQDAVNNNGSKLILTPEALRGIQRDYIIMHPLPRVDEIHRDVDDFKQARYFQQSKNGMYVRAALLEIVAEHNLK